MCLKKEEKKDRGDILWLMSFAHWAKKMKYNWLLSELDLMEVIVRKDENSEIVRQCCF